MVLIPFKLNIFFTALLLLLTVVITIVHAEEETDKLKPLVISATRTPVTLEKVGGSSVTVITQKDIETSQQTDVAEILKSVPGLDVVSNGGLGATVTIFMRGSDSKNALVLIDGVPFNDPSSIGRSADLGMLTLDNVERIEVIRGAQSVMYGSNATAGVVNIITKKGTGKPAFAAGLMAGSYATAKMHGAATGKINGLHYSVAAAAVTSEGFSIANDRNEEIPHAGNTSEKDGYQNTTLSVNAGYQFSDNFEISYIGRKITAKKELDDYDFGAGLAGDQFSSDYPPQPQPNGDKKQRTDSHLTMHSLKVDNSFDQRFFQSTLSYSESENFRESITASGGQSNEYLGKIALTSWQGELNFDSNSLGFGLDQSVESMTSEDYVYLTKIDLVSASTTSVWIHDQWYLLDDALVLSLGVRGNNHENFGSANNYRFAPSFQAGNLKLKMSLGTGFRAPSLYELYSSYGNKNLEPEISTTWDVGFEQQIKSSLMIGITWFDMLFEDRINFTSTATTPYGIYQQADGKTISNGAESFVAINPSKVWKFRFDHTYTFTKDPDGKRLVRRPNHKLLLNSDYQPWESTSLKTTLQWVGERDETASAKKENGELVNTLAAYTLINLASTHDITENVQGYLRVDNLMDEMYETSWSYASAGRSAYLGVKANF